MKPKKTNKRISEYFFTDKESLRLTIIGIVVNLILWFNIKQASELTRLVLIKLNKVSLIELLFQYLGRDNLVIISFFTYIFGLSAVITFLINWAWKRIKVRLRNKNGKGNTNFTKPKKKRKKRIRQRRTKK